MNLDFVMCFRFPNVTHVSVRATGLQWLGQLHALAELRGLTGLTVLPEGNPIHGKIWRDYAIYRLSHWGLKEINDEAVCFFIRFTRVLNVKEQYRYWAKICLKYCEGTYSKNATLIHSGLIHA